MGLWQAGVGGQLGLAGEGEGGRPPPAEHGCSPQPLLISCSYLVPISFSLCVSHTHTALPADKQSLQIV